MCSNLISQQGDLTVLSLDLGRIATDACASDVAGEAERRTSPTTSSLSVASAGSMLVVVLPESAAVGMLNDSTFASSGSSSL
jgi:hypothetical protein